MAVRDHSLDDKIINAAKKEFMELGYQKASLHKIAEQAGLTTGAVYTRYKNKDDLFCSLMQNMLSEVRKQSAPIRQIYEEVVRSRSTAAFIQAIQKEEEIYLNLLFEHYEECVLFFCRSEGSSVNAHIREMMKQKTRETVEFLKIFANNNSIDFNGVELILYEQFHFYSEILEKGYTKEKAVSCMKTVELFLEAGWKTIFQQMVL